MSPSSPSQTPPTARHPRQTPPTARHPRQTPPTARHPRRARSLAVVAAAAALLLAACGGGGGSTASAKSTSPVAGGQTAAATSGTGGNVSSEPTDAKPETPFFAKTSPWNTRVDTATIDPRSDTMMRQAKERVGVVESSGDTAPTTSYRTVDDGLYVNTSRWTTPIVTGGVATKLHCRQTSCGDSAPGNTLDVPTDVSPDPRYDGWFTIIDKSGTYAYDLWRARRESNGTISYEYMRRWLVKGSGYQKPQQVSARGSGLPLFAGLIRPGELQAGEIDHALAISVPGPAQRYFVQPASVTDGNGRTTSLPEGARIRLKANVKLKAAIDPDTGKPIKLTAQQQRTGDALVAALRTYGAIVVDRAAVPTLYAQRDVTSSLLTGNELQGLTLDDFEVVKLGTKYTYPPVSGTATGSAGE